MLSYFRRKRQQQNWFAKGVQIAALHEQMATEVPAAAYLFARTLHNARHLLEESSLSLAQKISRVDEELRASRDLSNADGGIGILALQFIRMLLSSQEHADVGTMSLSATFGTIAQLGARYRTLDERDFVPPANEDARRILNRRGNNCIADLVQRVRTESETAGQSVDAVNDDVWSLLAMFDLRHEADSGRLAGLLKALGEAVVSEPTRHN